MKMRLIEVGINSPTPHEKALLPVEELVQNFETTKYGIKIGQIGQIISSC